MTGGYSGNQLALVQFPLESLASGQWSCIRYRIAYEVKPHYQLLPPSMAPHMDIALGTSREFRLPILSHRFGPESASGWRIDWLGWWVVLPLCRLMPGELAVWVITGPVTLGGPYLRHLPAQSSIPRCITRAEHCWALLADPIARKPDRMINEIAGEGENYCDVTSNSLFPRIIHGFHGGWAL